MGRGEPESLRNGVPKDLAVGGNFPVQCPGRSQLAAARGWDTEVNEENGDADGSTHAVVDVSLDNDFPAGKDPVRRYRREQALDRFNAYVRGPLHDAVLDTVGNETHVPYHLCMVAFLPMNFYSLVNILGCDNGLCERSASEGGYPTVTSYMVTQVIAWFLCLLLTFPLTHPVLLRLMKFVMSCTDGHLQVCLAGLCCPLAYAYTYVCGGIIWGLLMVNAEQSSPHLMAALTFYLALLVLQALLFFKGSGDKTHSELSCRCVRRQVDQHDETIRPILA